MRRLCCVTYSAIIANSITIFNLHTPCKNRHLFPIFPEPASSASSACCQLIWANSPDNTGQLAVWPDRKLPRPGRILDDALAIRNFSHLKASPPHAPPEWGNRIMWRTTIYEHAWQLSNHCSEDQLAISPRRKSLKDMVEAWLSLNCYLGLPLIIRPGQTLWTFQFQHMISSRATEYDAPEWFRELSNKLLTICK